MKKVISMILTSVMAVSALSVSAGAVDYGAEYVNQPTKTYTQKFNDVPTSHWAFSYIGEMTEREVVSGYPNGNFYEYKVFLYDTNTSSIRVIKER